MKSTLTISPHKEWPKLMQCAAGAYKGAIVLFDGHSEGTVVYVPQGTSHLGYRREAWTMSDFEPFTGALTLEN